MRRIRPNIQCNALLQVFKPSDYIFYHDTAFTTSAILLPSTYLALADSFNSSITPSPRWSAPCSSRNAIAAEPHDDWNPYPPCLSRTSRFHYYFVCTE
jgi:hypothetical protein